MQLSDDLDREQRGVAAGETPAGGGRGRASATRKLLHAGMAIAPAAGWWIGYQAAVALVAIELGGSVLVDVARRRWGWVNRLLWRVLPTTFRSRETQGVMGSTWFGLGSMAALLLFGRDVGGTAILYLAWGDPAAELVGRRWGSPGKKKTVAGSAGCLAACMLAAVVGVGLGGLNPWAALAGALVATATERWSPPPDDNLWMPLSAGLAIVVVGWVMSVL